LLRVGVIIVNSIAAEETKGNEPLTSMNGPTVPHDRSAAAVGIDDDANDKNMEDGQTVRTNSTTDVSHHTGK